MPKPAPIIPSDIDLRDFPFTPIFRAKLFGSWFHANVTDSEWRAGVTLWLKSWDQAPAGTLPTTDIELCRLAELGRDLQAWAALRDNALHGWVECADGRLHHPVVAEGVLDAWAKRKSAKDKGMAGAIARWKLGNSTGNATAIAQAIPTPMPNDGKGREGKGIEEKGKKTNTHAHESKQVATLPDWLAPTVWESWKAERRERKKPLTARAEAESIKQLTELREKGSDPTAVIAQSIVNGWTGLFEVKSNGNGTRGPPYKTAKQAEAEKFVQEATGRGKSSGSTIEGQSERITGGVG
jgi:hypothetical protein